MRAVRLLKFGMLLLTTGAVLHGFDLEEKPCGRDHGGTFLRDMQPTTEQEKIDIGYYGLDLNMDITTLSMEKAFIVKFTVIDTTLETIELDYSTGNGGVGNIAVSAVLLDGDSVTYTHGNDLLSIPLPEPATVGQAMELEIFAQSGPASNSEDYGFNWDYEFGQRAIWTSSQPYNARHWWPSVDYPRDKADSVDIVVTIADHLTVASNGRLSSNTDNGDGTRTWHWHVGYPIATYLVSLSIYDFYVWGDVYVNTAGDTLPIEFYTYSHPDNPNPSYMTENYLLLPEMIGLFEEQFGPYPFMGEKYGHAEWGENWGLEHQTLTSMGDPTERRVAHELAHMWYGDMITCHSYHHIWLNEGFARYAEALWWEEHYGPSGYREKMESFEYYGGGTIYVEDTENESIFGLNLSYNKPAWVLHMLRHMVGDETFFEIMRSYADDPRFKYGTATTEDFQLVVEELTGEDYSNFFQQWIYGQGFPHYRAFRAQTGTDLLVQTIQSGLAFDLPVDFRITTTGSIIDTVLRIDEQFMTFHFEIPEGETVTDLVMDPGDWILKSTDYVVGLAQDELAIPLLSSLEENYPNPFNPSTTIPYKLAEDAQVELSILDLTGREIRTLVHAHQARGEHSVQWSGRDEYGVPVESGVYLCRLMTGKFSDVRKLLLVR